MASTSFLRTSEESKSNHTRGLDPSVTQERPPLTEAPEIGSGAWKVIMFLLVGGVLMLASLAAYVFSALDRFQDCF